MTLGYIDDGQTRDGFVAPVERLHPALRFQFRPLLCTERAIVTEAVRNGSERDAMNTAAALIANRVTKWDLKKPSGDLVPLTSEHTIRLQPTLLLKVYEILLGNRAPDPDPEGDGTDDPHKPTRDLQNLLSGKPPEDSQEGREGN